MTTGRTPDQELDSSDRGDDVQRRFRYQSVYTGILALSLFDDTEDFDTLYCEHFDDVLIKCTNGKCIAVQVKTRDVGGMPWRSNDEDITKSLQRFAALDGRFPDIFRRFAIVSNVGFWKERKDWHNLPYLIEQVHAKASSIPPDESLAKSIQQLSKASGLDPQTLIRILRKTKTQDSPGLNDIELRLVKLIKGLKDVGNRRYDELDRIASGIISLVGSASALSFDSPRRDFCALLENPADAAAAAVIKNKRISGAELQACIANHLSPHTVLRSANLTPIEQLPKGITKLEIKMAAGGIAIGNVELASDWKYSIEYFLNEWLYKLGTEQANAQYQQLATIVRTEISQAFDHTFTPSREFGGELLVKIRESLRTRFERDKHLFFDCEYEHVLGIVSMLTEECKFWWSDKFALPREGAV